MRHLSVAITLFVLAASGLQAAKDPDPRLATVRKALVLPADDLAAEDRPVAACVTSHLKEWTPIDAVTTKDEADVILKVGSTSKKATIVALLPDGTSKLWAGELDLKAGFGWYKFKRDACGIAEGLTEQLREAMRKARDKSK